MTALDQILPRLHGVRILDDRKFEAKCPAHDDKIASLSITGADRKLLIHCHAKCKTENIMAAIGLGMNDLFDSHDLSGPPRPRIVDTYDYYDESGELLFQTVRFEPKDFRQRRPDGNGGWLWNLRGVERVLYRLPQVLGAVENGETVVIVEGEKDAENVVQNLGLCATTCSGGVGKWRKEYSLCLVGANVLLLPDNDLPGKKDAPEIARALHESAKGIQIIELPGLAEKEDVSDWLEHGGTREALNLISDDTPLWVPPAADVQVEQVTAVAETTSPATKEVLDAFADQHGRDVGNALLLTRQHGDGIRYCHPWKKWFVWNEKEWTVDDRGHVRALAKLTVRSIYARAARTMDDRERRAIAAEARASDSSSRMKGMIEMAQDEVPVISDELDGDLGLFNTESGTLQTEDMKLREHRCKDLITKRAHVFHDSSATAPRWNAFLERVLPQKETREFLQRAVGSALTGRCPDQVFFILQGEGANGKSVFMETIMRLFGDYAVTLAMDTLLVKKHDAIPNDLARLRGARLVAASEPEVGRTLAMAVIKLITGNDTITARFMRGEFFEFMPTFKLFIRTNDLPRIRTADHATWRRIMLIPFAVTIPPDERDGDLGGKLQDKDELSGVFNWVMEGYRMWMHEGGLNPPETVTAATQKYRNEEDELGRFMAECCVQKANTSVPVGELHESYKNWGGSMTKEALGREMKKRGSARGRPYVNGKRTRAWLNIGLAE